MAEDNEESADHDGIMPENFGPYDPEYNNNRIPIILVA
jgi:hypothetical protein